MIHNNMIIGAGHTGMLLAIYLKQHGIPVTLVGPKITALSSMVYAIHPQHNKTLYEAGIDIPNKTVTMMRLNTANHDITLSINDVQRTSLCHIITHKDLTHALIQTCINMHIPWITDTPTKLQHGEIQIQGKRYQPDKIFACDGSRSWVRQHTPISVKYYHYKQYAHIAILSHPYKQLDAYQHFSHECTLALLPMSNPHQSALIWSCNSQIHQHIIEHGLKSSLEKFHRIKQLAKISHHQHLPLIANLADQFSHKNIFLLGNALHTVHPLAGIGFNLAISDIETITQMLLQQEPNEYYEKKRKPAHLKAHILTDTIARYNLNSLSPLYGKAAKYLLKLPSFKNTILEQVDRICLTID